MDVLRLTIAAIAMLVAGCSFDPYGDLTCSDGETDGNRACVSGVWVVSDAGGNLDAADGGGPEDMGTDMTVADAGPDAADAGDDGGQDTCVPETDEELCAAASKNCGSIEVTDSCGTDRMAACGTCTDPESCGGGGVDNVCGCQDSDDQALCTSEGAECGAINVFDPACGAMREVQCGGCSSPETCGGAGADNQCGCVETEAEFCARLGANCGIVDATDLCGNRRSIDCGSCSGLQGCGDGGTPNVCGCDATTVCQQDGAECGMADFSGSCPNVGTVDCGGCGAEGSCSTNMCACNGGYEYDSGGGTCVDVDECATGADNCATEATCSNSPGSFSCTCNPGYMGSGQTCTDVDECSDGTDNCDMNATCTNTDGGFTCACDPGFTGDGVTCTPIPSNPPTISEVVSIADSSDSTLTTGNLTAQNGSLYVAFVALNTDSRSVDSVTGFGQNFSQLYSQCNGDDTGTLDVWTLRSSGGTNGPVTVTMSDAPYAASVIVYKIDGAATMSDPIVRTATVNTNGVGGGCSGGTANSSFNGTTTPDSADNLMLLGWSRPGTSVSMPAAWDLEDSVSSSGAIGGRNTDLSVFSEVANAGGVAVDVDTTFGSSTQWIGGLVEIAP